MPLWMVIQMPLTTMQMIQKMKMHTKQTQLFSYDDENPDDEKNEGSGSTMQKSTKSLLMTWVKTWILTKKTTSFLTMMLKRGRRVKDFTEIADLLFVPWASHLFGCGSLVGFLKVSSYFQGFTDWVDKCSALRYYIVQGTSFRGRGSPSY